MPHLRPILPVLLLAGPAWAAPTFVSLDPGPVEIAAEAWRAAVACTGWEAAAHDEVLIERTYVAGGFGGLAHIDEAGLRRIEIGVGIRHTEEVLVHEVAHAWVHGGPVALTEGRTDLLADCIARRRPGLAPLQWDDGRHLDALPDLLAWTSDAAAHRPGNLDSVHTASYLGADRLLRTASLFVEPQALWPRSGALGWGELGGVLDASGEEARLLREVLEGGEEVQREALSDADRDGMPQLAEVLLGTRADRWDTDGDGWWDGAGAARPPHAVPLPRDGSAVCSGFATPADGGTVTLRTGGDLRGRRVPVVAASAGTIPILAGHGERGTVLARSSVLLSLRGAVEGATGGAWGAVRGDLVPDPACLSEARFTVWAEHGALAPHVPAYASALEVVLARAEVTLGRSDRRVVVALGDPPGWRDGVVFHGRTQVELALAEGDLEPLAAAAASATLLRAAGVEDWDAAEALAAELTGEVHARHAARWHFRVQQCVSGWAGVVSGRCEPL